MKFLVISHLKAEGKLKDRHTRVCVRARVLLRHRQRPRG